MDENCLNHDSYYPDNPLIGKIKVQTIMEDKLNSIKKKVMRYSGMIGWILTVIACGKVSSSKTETADEKDIYSPKTETFLVVEPDENGNKKEETILVGTVKVDGMEENWVSAKKESEAAKFLILMYVNDLDYMKICSKSLDKNKVDQALSKWRSQGGGYVLGSDETGKNIAFYGGDGSIWHLAGKGVMKIKMVQEKATVIETNNKYTVTDIEFD
jgi:hypothetical protein